jgi:hypothetical protein
MPRVRKAPPRGEPRSTRRAARDVSQRWTPSLTQGGWTPVSDFFLENYAALNPPLTTTEAMLVIQLMRHKWSESCPYPAFKTLARRMGMSDTAVRNHARSLEKKGCLQRLQRVGLPNLFDLKPLLEKLEELQQGGLSQEPSETEEDE